jgi:hypothetical protein
MFDQEDHRAQTTGMGSTNPGMPLADRLSNSGATQSDTAAYHLGKEQARRRSAMQQMAVRTSRSEDFARESPYATSPDFADTHRGSERPSSFD